MQIGAFRFDRGEFAGSLGDLGTLIPQQERAWDTKVFIRSRHSRENILLSFFSFSYTYAFTVR
jgi:hypothetical protein